MSRLRRVGLVCLLAALVPLAGLCLLQAESQTRIVPRTMSVAQGTVLASAVHVATVTGGALVFIDGVNLGQWAGHTLTLTDAANKTAVGAAWQPGTGETLDAEQIAGAWTNNAAHPYETFTPGTGTDITRAANTTGFADATQSITTTSGALYQATRNLTYTGASRLWMTYWAIAPANSTYPITSAPQGGASTTYITCPSAGLVYYGLLTANGVTVDFSATGLGLKRVLTPSTSGVTIGAAGAQSWSSIQSGFDPNNVTAWKVTRTNKSQGVTRGTRILPR